MGAIKSGRVKIWLEDSGTGFLAPIDGGPDVFVQRSALTDGSSLVKDALVTFEMGWDSLTNRPIAAMCVGAVDSGAAAAAGGALAAPVAGGVADPNGMAAGGFQGGLAGVPPPPPAAVPALGAGAYQPPAAQSAAYQGAAYQGAAYQGAAYQGAAYQAAPAQHSTGFETHSAVSDNLFISGLPGHCTEETVKQIFGAYGMVVSVKVLPDKGKPDRACLVRMSDLNIAQWLVENLHGNIPVGLSTPISVKFSQKSAQTTTTGGTMTGTVRIWIEERGMGFIIPATGGEELFVHRSNLCDGHSLIQGATVTFDPAWDVMKNKPVAKKVSGAVPNPSLVALGMGYGAGGKGAIAAAQAAAVGGAAAVGPKSGFVKIWFEEKGYGFLSPSDGTGDSFAHRTSISDGQPLIQGNAVTWNADWDPAKARFVARDVFTVATNTATTKTGVVKIWFEEKGYGFLSADDNTGDAFVHRSALTEMIPIVPGMQMQYEAHWDSTKNKYIATKAFPITGATAVSSALPAAAPAAIATGAPAAQQQSECVQISGLPADMSEETLRSIFAPYGTVVDMRLSADGAQGQSAWMQMGNAAQATWMCSNLNGNMPVGLESPIWVQYAAPGAEYGKAPTAPAVPAIAPY